MRFRLFIIVLLIVAAAAILVFQQPGIDRPTLGFAPAKRWTHTFANGKVEIDRATGQLVRWVVDDRTFIDADTAAESPMSVQLSESAIAHFSASTQKETWHKQEGEASDELEIAVNGFLKSADWRTPAVVRYRFLEGARKIAISFSVDDPNLGEKQLERWSWTLPLSLAPRKRIYFKGEHGLDFETRYFYQFTSKGGKLLQPADRNEWRWFTLDQLGENAFRLWKSESETTAPLVMQEGSKIPPYAQIRNPDRGLSIEVPALRNARGGSLQIDASRGGRAILHVWSPSFEAISGKGVKELFEATYELILTADSSEAALFKTRNELNARYPSTPLPNAEKLLQEDQWVQDATMKSQQYVSGGYPFAKGLLRDVRQIQLKVDGHPTPVQSDPLGYWPDGSLKWALLTFSLDPTKGVESCPAPYVSLRNGKYVPVEVGVGPVNPAPLAPGIPFSAQLVAGGGVVVKNGALVVSLSKGTEWIGASLNGKTVLEPSANIGGGYLEIQSSPTSAFPFHANFPGGVKSLSKLSIESAEIEISGPLMKVIKLTGAMNGQEKMPVSLRLKFYAGLPNVEISYSTEFTFNDPRKTFLTALGIELAIKSYDLDGVRFGEVTSSDSKAETSLVQESRTSRWLKGIDSKAIKEGGSAGWVEATGEGSRFVGVIRNFVQTAPKAITVSPAGAIRFELWPSTVPAMDMRRYSNFPHLGQGEAVPTDADWVETSYYPNSPIEGISRTHELLLSFEPDNLAIAKVSPETLAADYQSPPLLYAGFDKYTAAGVILPGASEAAWPRAWKAWENLRRFWLYHRGLYGWDGFWSFGDFRHRFRDGYGWILPPDLTVSALNGELTPEELEKHEIADSIQSQDWSFDNGRWGWTNTEGIPNFFLQSEYLRTGDRTVYFAAEAMARFSRDVVIRQSGQWFGAGTRHGVQHWSDGSHEERQLTPAEYRIHYFLSGDGRTRDVVEKLYEGHFNVRTLWDPACHGGRLSGLSFHAELTGQPEHFEQLAKYAHTFLNDGKLSIGPTVEFPSVTVKARAEQPEEMFFNYYGGWHSLLEYQYVTQDPALKAAIIDRAEATIHSAEKRQFYKDQVLRYPVSYSAIAYAAQHAADPLPYRKFLQDTLREEGWRRLYQPVTSNPAHWSGRTAFLLDNSPGCFFWANWAPYICAGLGKDTVFTPAMESGIRRNEEEGAPQSPTEGRWQTEADEFLELRKYLDPQKPWLKHP